MNIWGIPKWLEDEVRARDKTCVYCGVRLLKSVPRGRPRKTVATWEHIINDARIITRENIALCCAGCNSSKGAKKLSDWMESNYCKDKNISKQSVAKVIKVALCNDTKKTRGK